MRVFRLGASALALVSFLLIGNPAIAGNGSSLDNPDLVDVDGADGDASKLGKHLTQDEIFMEVTEDNPAFASGFLAASGDESNAEIVWVLYEPDGVKRTGGVADIRQANFVGIGVFTSYEANGLEIGIQSPGYLSYAAVDGCKAKAKFVGSNDSDGTCKWSIKCSKNAIPDALELSDSQIAALADAFGSTKISVSSSTVKNECFED